MSSRTGSRSGRGIRRRPGVARRIRTDDPPGPQPGALTRLSYSHHGTCAAPVSVRSSRVTVNRVTSSASNDRRHMQLAANLDDLGLRERVRDPRQGDRARRPGPQRDQSRHRPARLQDAAAHRRGRGQGPPRRPSRLYAGARHHAAARGRGGRHPRTPRRRGEPRAGDGGARRQDDDVLRHPDVRRAGGRDPLPQSRLPHLRIGDPLQRGQGRAHRAPREPGLLLQRRRRARQDQRPHAARHRQQAPPTRPAA